MKRRTRKMLAILMVIGVIGGTTAALTAEGSVGAWRECWYMGGGLWAC